MKNLILIFILMITSGLKADNWSQYHKNAAIAKQNLRNLEDTTETNTSKVIDLANTVSAQYVSIAAESPYRNSETDIIYYWAYNNAAFAQILAFLKVTKHNEFNHEIMVLNQKSQERLDKVRLFQENDKAYDDLLENASSYINKISNGYKLVGNDSLDNAVNSNRDFIKETKSFMEKKF